MKLYTFQSYEIFEDIFAKGEYIPAWDKLFYKKDADGISGFESSYKFMIDSYNERTGTSFETPPVFWCTSKKQAIGLLRRDGIKPNDVLIMADVPDSLVLMYDDGAWHCVLNECTVSMSDDWWWTDGREAMSERYFDMVFDRRYDEFGNIKPWVVDTWRNIFHIPKRDKHNMEIHAVTGSIKREWLT